MYRRRLELGKITGCPCQYRVGQVAERGIAGQGDGPAQQRGVNRAYGIVKPRYFHQVTHGKEDYVEKQNDLQQEPVAARIEHRKEFQSQQFQVVEQVGAIADLCVV